MFGKVPQRQYSLRFATKGEKCTEVFTLEIKATVLGLWQHKAVVNPTWRKGSVPFVVRKVSPLECVSNDTPREMTIARKGTKFGL